MPRPSLREPFAVRYAKHITEHDEADARPVLAHHRFAVCVHASDCRRLCPRLVKGPGISQVACVNIETGEQRPLYESLEDPDFECPEGLF